MHRQTKAFRSGDGSIQRAARLDRLVLLASLLFSNGPVINARQPGQATRQEAATARAAADTAQVRELEYGQPIARELAGGEVHAYRMTLAVGQYVQFLVEQRGIEAAVKVFGPDDKQVAEVDSQNGTYGPESICLVTEAQGSYRVEVRTLEKGALRGGYEISIKETRAATAQDNSRFAAQKAYVAGNQARARGTKELMGEALRKYEEALALYKAVDDRGGEAASLNNIGEINYILGESQKALDYFNLALAAWESVGDRGGKGNTLTDIGLVYDLLGEKQKALDYFNQALPLRKAVGDSRGEANALTNIGLVYDSLGEKQKALDYLNQVLPLRKSVGDRNGEASSLYNVGLVYDSLGERQKALDYYNQALPLWKDLGDLRSEAYALTSLGFVYASLGERQKALDYYNQALPLRRTVGDRRGEANTLTNIGVVYDLLGEKQKALDYYNQALPILKAVGNRRGEAYALTNIGLVYDSLGEKQKALDYYNQALALRRAVGDRRGEADALRNIARAERDMGNLSLARDAVKAALPLIEFIRSNVGSQDLRSSFFATVQDYYELDIDILMRSYHLDPSGGYAAQALQTYERARARSLVELLAESGTNIRQGVDPGLAERERTLQQQLNVKVEQQFRLLSGKHTPEQATAAAAAVEALMSDFQQVQAQIRATSPAYAALTQPQPLSFKDIQQQVLDSDTLLLEYSLGEENSYLWLVSQTSLTCFTLPKRSEIEASAVALTRLLSDGGTPEKFDIEAAALSRMLLAPVAPYLAGKRLLIVSEGALQYVPFAALPQPTTRGRSRAPMPLIAEHEIINLPSASTLATLRRQVAGRHPAAKRLAVLADPVFTADDARVKTTALKGKASTPAPVTPKSQRGQQEYERAAESARAIGLKRAGIDLRRLPFSRYEAERLLALVPRQDALAALDFDASLATAMSADLRRYRIVHFATHGYLNPERPELSGLVLSLVDKRGVPQDGFLSLPEVYNLRLASDLVVLSACQTGLGKQVRGEGLVGLTRGFMYSGSPRVVASLWAVEDKATAEMMARFYTAMLKHGLRPAAALREAQVSMWKEARWSDPHKWAGFIFQGEWR